MCVKLGDFILHHPENGKVRINRVGGEGGLFTVEQVEEALDQLWAKYF